MGSVLIYAAWPGRSLPKESFHVLALTMTMEFQRDRAEVYLASTPVIISLNNWADCLHLAAIETAIIRDVKNDDLHVISPLLMNGDGTLRCYVWIALNDGTRCLRTMDFDPNELRTLPEPGAQGLKHLVHLLLSELPAKRLADTTQRDGADDAAHGTAPPGEDAS